MLVSYNMRYIWLVKLLTQFAKIEKRKTIKQRSCLTVNYLGIRGSMYVYGIKKNSFPSNKEQEGIRVSFSSLTLSPT